MFRSSVTEKPRSSFPSIVVGKNAPALIATSPFSAWALDADVPNMATSAIITTHTIRHGTVGQSGKYWRRLWKIMWGVWPGV